MARNSNEIVYNRPPNQNYSWVFKLNYRKLHILLQLNYRELHILLLLNYWILLPIQNTSYIINYLLHIYWCIANQGKICDFYPNIFAMQAQRVYMFVLRIKRKMNPLYERDCSSKIFYYSVDSPQDWTGCTMTVLQEWVCVHLLGEKRKAVLHAIILSDKIKTVEASLKLYFWWFIHTLRRFVISGNYEWLKMNKYLLYTRFQENP